jgi:hypothetical protein
MIYSDSGSDLEKFRCRFRIQPIFSTVFQQQQKIVQNLAFSMLEAALFPINFTSHCLSLTFVLIFLLDPDPNLVSGMHSGYVSVSVKVVGPAADYL